MDKKLTRKILEEIFRKLANGYKCLSIDNFNKLMQNLG